MEEDGTRRAGTMQEVWLHLKWAPGSERPAIFGVHATKASARLDCPADVWDEEEDWIVEGVAPLGRDPFLLEGLREYVELWKELVA
jgi:hypothetical protein